MCAKPLAGPSTVMEVEEDVGCGIGFTTLRAYSYRDPVEDTDLGRNTTNISPKKWRQITELVHNEQKIKPASPPEGASQEEIDKFWNDQNRKNLEVVLQKMIYKQDMKNAVEKRKIEEEERMKMRPLPFQEICNKLMEKMTPEMKAKYVTPYKDRSTRHNPSLPGRSNCIPKSHMIFMKRLIDFFPEGITEETFLRHFQRIMGETPELAGYSFPKDDDPTHGFKLSTVFWIPDHEPFHLPRKLLFPVDSHAKYGGSIKPILEIYWDRFLAYMKKREVVWVSQVFDSEEKSDGLFHAHTGIWFSLENWSIPSYVRFFELLLENFDPKNEQFKILHLPPERGSWRERVYLVIAGEKGEFAKKFEKAARENFRGKLKPTRPPSPPPTPYVPPSNWRYEDMEFLADKEIRKDRDAWHAQKFDIVAAGNIWNFHIFYVVLVKHIAYRDRIIAIINEIMEQNKAYTRPEFVRVRDMVMFQNTTNNFRNTTWRRGLVIRLEKMNEEKEVEYEVEVQGEERTGNIFSRTAFKKKEKKTIPVEIYTVEVLDIDTGETNVNIPLDSLRNMTEELFKLPVLAVPVRFSINGHLKKDYLGFSLGNRVLGKYLHMLLVDANKGARFQFHFWDDNTYYTPGVWVVSGHLIDIIAGKDIKPLRSISTYIWEIFGKNPGGIGLPEWEALLQEEDIWNAPALMRNRLPNISYMISYYCGLGAQIREQEAADLLVGLPRAKSRVVREMEIDPKLEDVPISRIFVDEECGKPQFPPDLFDRSRGVSKLSRWEQIMGGLSGELEEKYKPSTNKRHGVARGYTGLWRFQTMPNGRSRVPKELQEEEDEEEDYPVVAVNAKRTVAYLRYKENFVKMPAELPESFKTLGKGVSKLKNKRRIHFFVDVL